MTKIRTSYSSIQAGRRGEALARMHEAKLPIPSGFIIGADAFTVFCEHNEIRDDVEELLPTTQLIPEKKLKDISKQIKKSIRDGEFPEELVLQIVTPYIKLGEPRVMLFSSLHGEKNALHDERLEEHLFGIKGDANLFEAIKELWSHFFDFKAVLYRQKHGRPHFEVPFAISVQEQPQAKVSAIVFTEDPTSHTKQTVLVKAVFGEGALENVIDGADYYWIRRGSGERYKEVTDTQKVSLTFFGGKDVSQKTAISFQKKRKLTISQLESLGQLAAKLQQHFYFPQRAVVIFDGEEFSIIETSPMQPELHHAPVPVTPLEPKPIMESVPRNLFTIGLSHVLTPAGHIPTITTFEGHLLVTARHLLSERSEKILTHQLEHLLTFTLLHCQPQRGILYTLGEEEETDRVGAQIKSLLSLRHSFPLLPITLVLETKEVASYQMVSKLAHRFGLPRDSKVSYALKMTTPAPIFSLNQFVAWGVDAIVVDIDAIDTALHGELPDPKYIVGSVALIQFMRDALEQCRVHGIGCFFTSTRLPDRAILDALPNNLSLEWITTPASFRQLQEIADAQ